MNHADYYMLVATIFLAPTLPKPINFIMWLSFLGLSVFTRTST